MRTLAANVGNGAGRTRAGPGRHQRRDPPVLARIRPRAIMVLPSVAPPAVPFSVRGEAAVDRQADADHEAGTRAAQPQHSGSDLLRPAKAAD